MAKKVGKDAAVKLSTATVVGMGTWSMDGISTEQIPSDEFGDEWKTFLSGMKDSGTISFSGHFDPADTTGQEVLAQALLYGSALTTLRLYVDNTSYYTPCATTGYFSPTLTTGAPTVLSSVAIVSHNISFDKSGLGACSFQGKISGLMVLV